MKNPFARRSRAKKRESIDPDDLEAIWSGGNITDVNGSYTGTPERSEVPEQDADDL